jgi:uncharacterized protein (TIGR02271 family)
MSQISSSSGTGSGSGTLTAFFDDQDDAQDAVDRLIQAGIPQASVRMVAGSSGSTTTSSEREHKGFFEALADFFMPDEDRYTYAEGLRRGGYMVTVSGVWGDDYDRALDILDDEGAVDLDQREQQWRSDGWTGYQSSTGMGSSMGQSATTGTGTSDYASSSTSGFGTSSRSDYSSERNEEGVIPVMEEELRIGKRDVSHGRVRVRSYVVEEPVNEQVSLSEERVVVERRPVDRALHAGDAAFQERELEAEEYAEEAVVEKTARVTEEIALRKEREQRQETISDTVRHTEVEVEDDRSLNQRGTGTIGGTGGLGGSGNSNR